MKLKAFLREFFYIPKHGKVREKVMLAHITLSVVMMVGCLAVMSLSAYAYFSHSASTGYITIQSAQFDVEVSITNTDEINSNTITVMPNGKGNYIANLVAGTYTVTLEKEGNAATGFCIITVAGDTYYTQQIGTDELTPNGYTEELSFTLYLTGSDTISISPHWGTSSEYENYKNNTNSEKYITQGGSIPADTLTNSIVDDSAEQNTDISSGTTAQTESVETEKTTTKPETEQTTIAVPETTTAATAADTYPLETKPMETTTAEITTSAPETEATVTTEDPITPVITESEASTETELPPVVSLSEETETTETEPTRTADTSE